MTFWYYVCQNSIIGYLHVFCRRRDVSAPSNTEAFDGGARDPFSFAALGSENSVQGRDSSYKPGLRDWGGYVLELKDEFAPRVCDGSLKKRKSMEET